MKKPRRSLGDHLYQTLLLLYPWAFRARYGRDMESLFRDRRRQVQGSFLSLSLLWLKAILDLAIQAPAEHVNLRRARRRLPKEGNRNSAGGGRGPWPRWETLRISARTLAKKPGYSFVAVMTLALGMGAATAVFTLVDGVLIRPLPFPEPEELVAIGHSAREGQDRVSLSDGLYLLYREQASSIDVLALYDWVDMNLVSGGEPEQVRIQRATPSFFTLLGIPPALGRTFLPQEELPNQEPVVILSHGLWRRVFGSDAEALDQILELDGVRRRVVGIMPAGFGYPGPSAGAWVPYVVDPAQEALTNFFGLGLARLAPGRSLEALDSELQGLLSRLTNLFPESGGAGFLADVGIRTRNRPLKEDLVGDIDTTLWILMGTVGLVLLIACANVANLLLVRAEGRRQELAVRLAMGAGHREVLRLFMGESVLLVGAAAFLGLVIANWALRISLGFVPTDLPRAAEIGIDLRIVAFTSLLSLACCIALGLIPLARVRAAGLAGSLRDGGERGATSGRRSHRLRDGLAVVQVALALVLLVGAGLMFRSFHALRDVDPGFQSAGLLTARVIVPPGEIDGWEETASFYRQLQRRLEAQPGVQAAGLTRRVPLSGTLGFTTVDLEGRPEEPGGEYIVADLAYSGPGYLETMGIPLLEGRAFQAGDGAQGSRAAMVSASFARRWWPEGSPLGQRISGGGLLSQEWWEVVGVVGDVHQASLAQDPGDMIYLPITAGSREAPHTMRAVDVVVRTTTSPLDFLPVLQRELSALNPRIPLANPRTVRDVVRRATAQTSFTMAVLGSSAGIALLLGLVGIYGVVSYLVSLRTVSYTHLTLPTIPFECRSRWAPGH